MSLWKTGWWADITTTMDIYAEATEEKKQEIIANLENKILIQ